MQITFARDLTGPNLGHPPDPKQGWGKADLTRAFDPAGGYIWSNEQQIMTGTGQLVRLPSIDNYQIKDTAKPVKITVAWTDAPGTLGSALSPANDLDLVVKFHGSGGNGKQALGNDFNTSIGRSNIRIIPAGVSDSKNNVEQVSFTLADTTADQFHVEILAKAIVADGINVWNGTAPRQNFGMFIENAITIPAGATRFSTLPSCRVVDTRNSPGPYGGPALAAQQSRSFAIRGQCGIPVTAKAIASNLTSVLPASDGYLTGYRSDIPPPPVSSLNYRAGLVRANNAILTMDDAGNISIYSNAVTNFLLDVTGYFE